MTIFKPRNVKICTQEAPNSILGGDLYQGLNLEATEEIHGFYHGTSVGAGSPKVINDTPILEGELMTPTLITRGVSHYGLGIYIKKYLKAKEELWKLLK